MDAYLASDSCCANHAYSDAEPAAANYRGLAKFMSLDEDNDLIAFRKFKTLSLYSLLRQQDHLVELENRVHEWEAEEQRDPGKLDETLQDAQRKLKEYRNCPHTLPLQSPGCLRGSM